MQAIGPYKLMKVEGQDGTWFDTLTAWYKFGHSALLAAHFGSTVTKLVSISSKQRFDSWWKSCITSDAHPCRKTSQMTR